MDLEFWNLIYEMHDGLSATVKWQGQKSGSFSVEQGVRQGVCCQRISITPNLQYK
jgi:hypothetical protein